jgi:DNA polymerase-3 subunit delta
LKINADSLATQLQTTLLRAYLVSGDEELLAGEAADAIRAAARSQGFTEREVFFFERGADWGEMSASARNLSLFGSRRILEIRLPTGKAGTAGNAVLASLIKDSDPDTLLLILTPKLDRDTQGTEWVRAAEAHGGWVQVWPVDAARLPAWLKGRCRRLKLDVTDEAVELLAARTEGNLLAAHQELEKLVLLGEQGQIGVQTLLASVVDSARFDVYQLNEAVLAGEAGRALRILGSLRAEGDDDLTLALWALTKAMRDLWNGLRAPSGASRQGGWQRQGAALEKGLRRARALPFAALTVRAERADRMIKGRLSGNAWDEMALLALEICSRPVLPPARGVLAP